MNPLFKTVNGKDFPAAEFFNISTTTRRNSMASLNQYLCSVDPEGVKCCSCDSNMCAKTCCIDVYWDKARDDSLEAYVEEKTFENNLDTEFECRPIMYPLLNNHQAQHVLMYVNLCKTPIDQINVPTWDFGFGDIYPNAVCTEQDDVKQIEYLSLAVNCLTAASNLTEGQLFFINDQYQLEGCVFNAVRPENVSADKFSAARCSNGYIDQCDSNNRYFKHCMSYKAPIGKYRNPHCKLCNEESPRQKTLQKPNEKCDCIDGLCEGPKLRSDHVTFFQLLPTRNGRAYIVKELLFKFNIKDFLDGRVHAITDKWVKKYLCEMKKQLCCDCEVSCVKYNTCCMDYWWDPQRFIEMDDYKDLIIEKTRDTKMPFCEKLIPHLDTAETFSYLMISTCPQINRFSYLNYRYCMDVDNAHFRKYIPVFGEDGYLYRNIFCARCNGMKRYEVARIKCLDWPRNSNSRCQFAIDEPLTVKYIVKTCSSLKNNCQVNDQYFTLCNAYTALYKGHKNFHCYLCENMSVNEVDTNKSLVIHADNRPCFSPRFLFRWSLLISFTMDLEIERVVDKNDREFPCEHNDLVNVLVGLNEYCNLKRIPIDVQSNNDTVTISNNVTHGCQIENMNMTLFLVTKRSRLNFSMFDLIQLFGESTLLYSNKSTAIYRFNTSFNSVLEVNTKLSFFGSHTNSKFILHPLSAPYISHKYRLSFQNSFAEDQVCSLLDRHKIEALKSLNACRVSLERNSLSGPTLRDENQTKTSLWYTIENGIVRQNVAFCDLAHVKTICEMIKLKRKIGTFDDSTAADTHEYILRMDRLLPCLEDRQFGEQEKLIHKVESYVTQLGTTLSVLCYIFMIPILRMLKKFQNLPGKCTLALTISLLLGDSMFLMAGFFKELPGNKNNMLLCKLVAILMHYGLIIAYAWGFAIAYDMMRCFSRIRLVTEVDLRMFKIYFITVNIYSLVLVGIAFFLDQSKTLLIGYGDNGICVPHKFYGRLYFFTIPLLASLVISIAFLIITLYKISKVKKLRNEVVRRNANRNTGVVIIALKLIFVLGLSEMIGFIQIRSTESDIATINAAFGLTYSFFRSTRGIYLFILYVCKREVMGSLKDSFLRTRIATMSSGLRMGRRSGEENIELDFRNIEDLSKI